MKLASLRDGGRDGALVVVSRDLSRAARAHAIAPTLQAALDRWPEIAPQLDALANQVEDETAETLALDPADLAAPLPRAFQWLDGSAYLSHVERARKARGAPMPPHAESDPLMYRGGSDPLLGPREPIHIRDGSWGADVEGEVAVIIGDVPRGASRDVAARSIRLIALVNDVSLRGLIPAELGKGFGFIHGKPPPAFAPTTVTPDELGDAWRDGKVHLPLECRVNDTLLGRPDAGTDMQFDFLALIVHAARTRPLGAGTIIGSGAVSNWNPGAGFSCLLEKRALEIADAGAARTPYLRPGDRVRIEMHDRAGRSVFGAIDQIVVQTEL